MCGSPGSPDWRTLRSAPNCSLLPASAISRLLSSQRAGDRASRRHLPLDPGALPLAPPREGRPMERGQRFTYTAPPHSPTSHRLAARRRLRSGRTPPGPLPAPPRRRPHPQPFRLPSAHPPRRGSGRVPRGQLEQQAWEQRSSHFLAPEGSVASLLPSVKQARAPRPARACKLLPGAGSREPRRRRAPSSAGERPAATSSRAKSSSPPPSLGWFVRPSVRGPLPPSPAAAPAPARQRVPSPPRRSARGLAGSRLSRSLPAPVATSAARSGARRPRASWLGPSPEGGGNGGAARAGRRGESGGGSEAAPWASDRSPPASGSGPGRERGAAGQRRER